LVSPGNMYLMLVSPVAAVYGSAWVTQGMGAAIANGTVEIGKVFIDAKFQFRRPKAIEQYDDFHFSSKDLAVTPASTIVDLLFGNQLTGGPNSNVIALDGNSLLVPASAVNVDAGSNVTTVAGQTTTSCMLNFGTATPNPKAYEIVISVNLGLVGPTVAGFVDFWYTIGGIAQSLVSDGGPMGGQTITWPCAQTGAFSHNTSTTCTGMWTYYLYVPAGLPSATMGSNNGARFGLYYHNAAAVTSANLTVDVLVKEAMFRPWDWTTFGDSVMMQRTAMPYRWWKNHRPAVRADEDDEKSNLPSLSLTSRRFSSALDALVIDQDSPVVIQPPVGKKKPAKSGSQSGPLS